LTLDLVECDDTLLGSLADDLVSEPYEADARVVEEGQIGDKLNIIGRGRVEVLSRQRDGSEARVGVREDGDFFGEIALLTRVPRQATVRTLERSLFLTLTRPRFDAMIEKVPHLRAHLDRVARERLATLAPAPSPPG
jgi:cAMP-dependent protein kinase regulator